MIDKREEHTYWKRKERVNRFYKGLKDGKKGIIIYNYKGFNWDE